MTAGNPMVNIVVIDKPAPKGSATLGEPVKKIQIRRVDPSLPLPRHQTPGSVGFDLLCRNDVLVPPGEICLIPANLIVEVPPGYMLLLAARSSLPYKKGLMLPNGVGIVDQDYRGPNDEIHIQVYNFTDRPVSVRRRDRLAQGIFVRIVQAEWEEPERLDAPDRGGFGSTGK